MTGQEPCAPACLGGAAARGRLDLDGPTWTCPGGALVAVGPVGQRHRADLLGLALAEGFGIERVGTARLLSREDSRAAAPARLQPRPCGGRRMIADAVSAELIVCSACGLAKPAEAFCPVRGPRSVGDWPARLSRPLPGACANAWRPGR
ncbi:MAG: hypothetical protein ACRD0K_19540 [Egibacteraceae bacterium]